MSSDASCTKEFSSCNRWWTISMQVSDAHRENSWVNVCPFFCAVVGAIRWFEFRRSNFFRICGFQFCTLWSVAMFWLRIGKKIVLDVWSNKTNVTAKPPERYVGEQMFALKNKNLGWKCHFGSLQSRHSFACNTKFCARISSDTCQRGCFELRILKAILAGCFVTIPNCVLFLIKTLDYKLDIP